MLSVRWFACHALFHWYLQIRMLMLMLMLLARWLACRTLIHWYLQPLTIMRMLMLLVHWFACNALFHWYLQTLMAMLVLMRLVPGLRARHYFTGSYKALRGDHFGFGFERHLCYNELKHTVSQKKSSNLTTTQHDDIRKPHLSGSGEIIAFRYSELNLLKMVTKKRNENKKTLQSV